MHGIAGAIAARIDGFIDSHPENRSSRDEDAARHNRSGIRRGGGREFGLGRGRWKFGGACHWLGIP
jgi:hypothetical protein